MSVIGCKVFNRFMCFCLFIYFSKPCISSEVCLDQPEYPSKKDHLQCDKDLL